MLDLLHVCCLNAEPDTQAMDTGEGTSSMGSVNHYNAKFVMAIRSVYHFLYHCISYFFSSVLRMPELDAAPHTAEHSAIIFLTMMYGRVLSEKANAVSFAFVL